jgi:nitrogen fixation/metabolism regulation signal transduction histidine kinase
MVDDSVKRVFALSRQDIYFIIIILMLAVNMAFNFSLVEPIRNLQEAIQDEQINEIRPQLEELLRSHNISLQTLRESTRQ